MPESSSSVMGSISSPLAAVDPAAPARGLGLGGKSLGGELASNAFEKLVAADLVKHRQGNGPARPRSRSRRQ